ncbi:hypothetical protein [Amycolatopsis anabasis]|uniref:hypothetical protein n=1 Tax=Amycolatopsis anabasis TaxID=1840409 RepID=UPI00131DAB18|nr:hypothetical protein [Amycolatopsis anabasis]
MTNDITCPFTTNPKLSELEQARHDLAEYRNRVRNRAIQGFHDGDWKLDELNTSLLRLGLDLYEPQYAARSNVQFSVNLQTDDNDLFTARERMLSLASASGREAVREALDRIVAERVGSDARITTQDLDVTVSYPISVVVN